LTFQDFEGVEVGYISLPGWQESIESCRTFDELPINARLYVQKIEELLGVPILWIGVGQSRDAIIVRKPQ
jgi:adenylosuccinate synthase